VGNPSHTSLRKATELVVGLIRAVWESTIRKYFKFHGKSRGFLFHFSSGVGHFHVKCSISIENHNNNIAGRTLRRWLYSVKKKIPGQKMNL
jgi:hypothetical protein